jgi:hypothetical protein
VCYFDSCILLLNLVDLLEEANYLGVKRPLILSVTARTKCYSIEGSFVDCTIEDTKLQKEEKDRWGESQP